MTLATMPSDTHLRRVPSLVYVNPSALTAEANYGTLLGMLGAGGVEVHWNYEVGETISEPFGRRPTAAWVEGIWATLEFDLQAWNTLTHIFPGVMTSTNITLPGSPQMYAGTKLNSATYKKILLVMPIDECSVNPCILAQYAVLTVKKNPVIFNSGTEATHRVIARTYVRPGETAAYKDLFIGAKASATILSS